LSEQANELLIKGKKAYDERDYKAAEQYYEKVLNDPNQNYKRCALINLGVLYGEHSQEFSKAVDVNRKLITLDENTESKTNLAESLLKDGQYKEARECALSVVNAPKHTSGERDNTYMLYPDTLDENGYETINTFFTLCSYLLDGSGNFKIENKQWLFIGLKKAINNSKASDKTKNALLDVIASFNTSTR
jgi:tetratricopeptide (TPR) repeat protein